MANNNEKFWRTIRIILLITGIVAGIAAAYGVLTQKVANNSLDIVEAEGKIDINREAIISNQQSIIEMKTDIKYIKAGVDDIQEELKK